MLAADDPRHGKVSSYTNHRCRCEKCREAQRQYMAWYMMRHPEQREKKNARQRGEVARM
jgi:hypothetical protein